MDAGGGKYTNEYTSGKQANDWWNVHGSFLKVVWIFKGPGNVLSTRAFQLGYGMVDDWD